MTFPAPQETPATWYDSLDSTNAEAARRLASGMPQDCWIIAREQTQGRGRANRSWTSPTGNFMGTRLWRVGADLQAISLLSLAVGLAVRTIIAQLHEQPEAVTTKWPNDVYIGDAKLCGILIETHKSQHGEYWAAIGIGVNLALAPHVPDGRQAATLSGVQSPPTPEQFFSLLDRQLTQLLASWPPGDTAEFCKKWSRTAFGIGAAVRLQSGELGIFSGIETDGAARVALDSGGQTSVHAGDLVFMSLEKARNAAGD